MGEDKVTKWGHCPPTTHRVAESPISTLTHLHHGGLQLHCRCVQCQRKVVLGLTALLTKLAPAKAGIGSSDGMHQRPRV